MDTLPYKLEMRIYGKDTSYSDACRTFEKINGQNVNLSDDHCLAQGFWIEGDSMGGSRKGNYINGQRNGVWREFDKDGRLLTEWKYAEGIKVREISYSEGAGKVVVDKPFTGFFLENVWAVLIISGLILALRLAINSAIYNTENGTNYWLGFQASAFVPPNFMHNMMCIFTIWFWNYKPENKRWVYVSNMLSITIAAILLVLFIIYKQANDL